MNTNDLIKVPGRLHSSQYYPENPALNHIVSGTDEIYDEAANAKQSDINRAVGEALDGKLDIISDLETIRRGASAGATAYQKPNEGISSTDLDSGVQTSLGKADSALQSQEQADWNESDGTKASFIKNKPTIPAAQIQSNWNQGDDTKADFIKNKPVIPDVSGKVNKSEMTVTPGTGADVDKTTIQLKEGTSATVLTAHQDISNKADKATTLAGYGITDGYTKTEGQALESEVDDRLDVQDAAIALLNGSEVIVVADHTDVTEVPNPDPQKIYREYGTNSYTDYMCVDATTTPVTWQALATYSYPGVDNVPTADSEKLVKSGGVKDALNELGCYIEGFGWVRVITDKDGKILAGIKEDGSVEWSVGVPTPIKEYITSVINSLGLDGISEKMEDLEWETMQPSEIIENYYITRAGFIKNFNGSYIYKYVIEADCILKYKTTLSNGVMCPYLVDKKEGKLVGGTQVYDGMLLLKKGDVVYIGYYNGGAESDIKVWYQNINNSVFVSDFIISNLGYVKGEADLVSGQNYINSKVVDVKLNQGEQYAIKFITGTGNVDRVTIFGYKEDGTEVTLVEETSIYNVVHFKTCPDDIVSIGLRMTAARIITPGSVYIEVSKGYLYDLLAKSESAGGDDYYAQKNIAYFGTSVPAQGYPQIVGTKLGANVYNQAIGSSMMRCGIPNSDYLNHNELGDDLGLGNVYFSNIMRSMSRTQKELKYIFDNWTADRRKANLIAKGYTAEQVENVVGYVDYIGGSFPEEHTDPTTPQSWPSFKPIDVYAGNGETYKSFRELAYSYCWDDSVGIESDLSMSGAITGTIKGRLQKFINGEVETDLFVFDHFRNDAIDSTSSQYLEVPSDPTDRNYAEGAFNYLMQQILLVKPNAQIVIVGHVDNDDTKAQLGHVWEAQEIAANRWGIPLLKLWELLGIRAYRWVTTTGYWDSNGVWHEDGYNGSNHVWESNNGLTAAEYENPRQIMINGVLTWVHDLTTRMIWFKDDIHPSGTLALNHFAEIIAKWISNLKK